MRADYVRFNLRNQFAKKVGVHLDMAPRTNPRVVADTDTPTLRIAIFQPIAKNFFNIYCYGHLAPPLTQGQPAC